MRAICYQFRPEVIEMLLNKGARTNVIITKYFKFYFGLQTSSKNLGIGAPFTVMNLALRSAYFIDQLSLMSSSRRVIHRNNNWRVLLKYGVELDPVRYLLAYYSKCD